MKKDLEDTCVTYKIWTMKSLQRFLFHVCCFVETSHIIFCNLPGLFIMWTLRKYAVMLKNGILITT
ncbi:hypothetical protein Pint_10258 [Pistacia integerrima]|uniref:Uncharacterized protein n=1 Tax=Pistacia integerrima TaxID=434235 RepID=A0ACC0XI42_9ROSI|nr:hypothetical protein Pint_10258 [Pistacia integerrima]